MSFLSSQPDTGIGFYRVSDSIKNFKIKVKLEKSSSINLNPTSDKSITDDANFASFEEYVFSWQEKILSQAERQLYSNLSSVSTGLEHKYKMLATEAKKTNRLFTYVDHDNFVGSNKSKVLTTNPKDIPLQVSGDSNTRYRNSKLSSKIVTVDYKPTHEAHEIRSQSTVPFITMYIMADLTKNEKKESNESSEAILCIIKYFANQVLSIQPDFNKGKQNYKVNSEGKTNQLFEFSLEHASQQPSMQDIEKERRLFKELYSRHNDYLKALVGHEFETPQGNNILRIILNAEILSAHDFEYGGLYVNYFIELPTGWFCSDPMQLSGKTCTGSLKCQGRGNVAHFSHLFSLEFFYDANSDNKKIPEWPEIFFQVISFDSWQRFRTEGYTYCKIPFVPGKEELDLKCWRPTGRSCVTEMRRFFVGGIDELEDISYVSKPSTFQGKILSKYGFRTESTGTLKVRFYTLHQSKAIQKKLDSQSRTSNIMQKIGYANTPAADIMKLLDNYQAAKLLMIQARENLIKDYDTIKKTDNDEW